MLFLLSFKWINFYSRFYENIFIGMLLDDINSKFIVFLDNLEATCLKKISRPLGSTMMDTATNTV